MINPGILEQYGATQKSLAKGEVLFTEGSRADFYYQVTRGEMRMINRIENGNDFIQGIFHAGQSFGEPPLLGQFPYPATAVAAQPTVVYKLAAPALIELLRAHFEVQLQLLAMLSRRMQYKSMQAKELSSYNADHQLLTLLTYLKAQAGNPTRYQVPLTRQELGELTGLRVETVIRTIKQLTETGKLVLHEGKIYL